MRLTISAPKVGNQVRIAIQLLRNLLRDHFTTYFVMNDYCLLRPGLKKNSALHNYMLIGVAVYISTTMQPDFSKAHNLMDGYCRLCFDYDRCNLASELVLACADYAPATVYSLA